MLIWVRYIVSFADLLLSFDSANVSLVLEPVLEFAYLYTTDGTQDKYRSI